MRGLSQDKKNKEYALYQGVVSFPLSDCYIDIINDIHYAKKRNGDVAYFPRFLAGWKTWVLSHMDTDSVKEKKFVAYPSGKGESWKLQAMPNPANPTPSSIHTIIPSSLDVLPYVVFIHKAGFIAEVATKGDITNLVREILG
mgnify:CR=1 FL=1